MLSQQSKHQTHLNWSPCSQAERLLVDQTLTVPLLILALCSCHPEQFVRYPAVDPCLYRPAPIAHHHQAQGNHLGQQSPLQAAVHVQLAISQFLLCSPLVLSCCSALLPLHVESGRCHGLTWHHGLKAPPPDSCQLVLAPAARHHQSHHLQQQHKLMTDKDSPLHGPWLCNMLIAAHDRTRPTALVAMYQICVHKAIDCRKHALSTPSRHSS